MKTINTNGLSFVEMIITMSIMIILGSVGILQVSKLQNYFLVTGAEEKLQKALQEAKKSVLEGQSFCSKISIQSEDQSQFNQSVFFTVENWNQPPQKQNFSCTENKNGEQLTSSVFAHISLEKKDDRYFAQFLLKDSVAENMILEAYDNNMKPLSFDATLASKTKNTYALPIQQNEEYFIKVFDSLHIYTLSSLDLQFYNANDNKLVKQDPSIIRVASIHGKTQSQEEKTGNLEIIYQAPYAFSSSSLIDSNNIAYLVRDLSIQFINANEAEGNASFFNASLFTNPNIKRKDTVNTCVFDQRKLQFSCLSQLHE